MISKENSNAVREAAAAAPTLERAGDNLKTASANSASASAPGVAQDGLPPSARGALPAYVPTRRRTRLNRLL